MRGRERERETETERQRACEMCSFWYRRKESRYLRTTVTPWCKMSKRRDLKIEEKEVSGKWVELMIVFSSFFFLFVAGGWAQEKKYTR